MSDRMTLRISAGPGCGKTYTATKICKWMRSLNRSIFLDKTPHTQEQKEVWEYVLKETKGKLPEKPSVLYCSYNKDFVPEIKSKVPSSGLWTPSVHTIHGAGYKVLRSKYGYIRMNENRGVNIVSDITGKNFWQMRDRFQWLSSIRYVSKLKDELLPLSLESLETLRLKYDSLVNMPIHKDSLDQCSKLLKEMKKIDRKQGIEYIDQIWLPLFILKAPVYDFGVVDECQDLSPARLMLVQKLCRHLVFVGDGDQSINAFAGADPYSFDKIGDISNETMPLKLSFRNPPNIVNKANNLMKKRIIPDKHPRTWLRSAKTENGKESACTLNEIGAKIEGNYENNLILCRFNAPLIQCATRLARADIPSFVYGRSIIKELMNIVTNRKAHSLGELEEKLDHWLEQSSEEASDFVKASLQDKVDCIKYIMALCNDIDEIETVMNDIIREDKKDSVRLSTIHKAKGKESLHVHILFPPVESSMATTDEQRQQEQNLHYVADTRTCSSYNLIHRE